MTIMILFQILVVKFGGYPVGVGLVTRDWFYQNVLWTRFLNYLWFNLVGISD